MKRELWPHQTQAIEMLRQSLRSGKRRPVLQAPTGFGKPRSSIYADIANGTFPKSIPLGEKAVGWLEDEIIQWQKGRIAERDRPNEAPARRRRR
jgi:prophage regulatory protein